MSVSSLLHDAAAATALFDRAAESLRNSPHRAGSAVRLPARGRLLATGDLHDNPDHFRKIVRLARLSEPDHHVVLHEIIHGEVLVNGMDLSHRMLARVAHLAVENPGRVHVLLANHELAQLTGQRVSKGAGDNVELFDAGLEYAFGDECHAVAEAIKGFIRAMPLAALSESGLLCAHSLPAPRMLDAFDPGVLDRDLEDEDYRSGGSGYLMVWGRGYGADQIETLAQRWGVRLFCLGHEHVDNGVALRGSRALILNSDHAMGTVIPLDLANLPTPEEAIMAAVRLGALPPVAESSDE